MSMDDNIICTIDLTEWERQMLSDHALKSLWDYQAEQGVKTDAELQTEKRWSDLTRKLRRLP